MGEVTIPTDCSPLKYNYHGNPDVFPNFLARGEFNRLGLTEKAAELDTRLVLYPGGQATAFCVGAALALDLYKLLRDGSTNKAYGVSGGAIALAYLAMELMDAHNIIDINAANKFVDIMNLFTKGGMIDWESFEGVIYNQFPLDPEALAKCQSALMIGVTPAAGAQKGELVWIDLRSYKKPADLILASSRVGILGNKGPIVIDIDGVPTPCVDYGRLSLETIITDGNPTDILACMNFPLEPTQPNLLRRAIQDAAAKIGDLDAHSVRKTLWKSGRIRREETKDILALTLDTRERTPRVGVFIPEKGIDTWCMHPGKLNDAKYGAFSGVTAAIEKLVQCPLPQQSSQELNLPTPLQYPLDDFDNEQAS